ncbi:MAG: hypothetical protein QOE70_4472 [Chthoniobacter sp.]|jgi:uncharacterized membrane protein|nr:hypothetical protein [Chthoniobacter sp.]
MAPQPPRALRLGAVLFAGTVFLVSWWHWWTFQYSTFDAAFYVQALWLALRGKWMVSLLNVPLMGNHAEPIVFLLTPLFAIWPHPMLLVAVQSAALASMAFTGFRIATRLGLDRAGATCLGLATLLTPATASVAIHEFHPEAFAAPLLLLLIEARLAERSSRFWLWFLAVLACKENMALLLVAFCAVFAALEWRRPRAWQIRWNLAPLLAAAAWLIICGRVISPWLNAGNVDYLQLYSHLGSSGGEIGRMFFLQPGRVLGVFRDALIHGDMVWALLLPLLLLPLLRLRWLLIASPILLQHLLSWRSSEWSLGAHYAAPFIPLFWMAAAEALAKWPWRRGLAIAVAAACVLAHLRFGPARELIAEAPAMRAKLEEREWKAAMLAAIPREASVTACQPFLSHLAGRERIYSLHHVLKGLKTLSRERYVLPPPTDVVVIDYADATTFSPASGFYHPPSRAGAVPFIPSSDRLLHEFLSRQTWQVEARNELAVFTHGEPRPPFPAAPAPAALDAENRLLFLRISAESPGGIQFRLAWEFGANRQRFPWLMMVLSDGVQLHPFIKGACAPEAGPGRADEQWTLVLPDSLPAGNYGVFAIFYDANEGAWQKKLPPKDPAFVLHTVEFGHHQFDPGALGPPK